MVCPLLLGTIENEKKIDMYAGLEIKRIWLPRELNFNSLLNNALQMQRNKKSVILKYVAD